MIIILAVALSPMIPVSVDVCTSTGTGNWSATGTWSCGHLPTASDDVMIANGTIVTFDLPSATVSSLTINDGNATSSLTLSGTNALTVTNNVLAINTTNLTIKSIDVGSGALNIGGSLNLSANGGTQVVRLTIGSGTVTVNGNINNANATANSKVIFSGAGTMSTSRWYLSKRRRTLDTRHRQQWTISAQPEVFVPAGIITTFGLTGSGTKETLQAENHFCYRKCNIQRCNHRDHHSQFPAIGGNLNVGGACSLTTGTNFTLAVTGSTTLDGTLTRPRYRFQDIHRRCEH